MLGRGSARWSTLFPHSLAVCHFHASRTQGSASAAPAKVTARQPQRVHPRPAPLPHVQNSTGNKQKAVPAHHTTRDACLVHLDGPADLLRLMNDEFSDRLQLTSSAERWIPWKGFLENGEAVCRLVEQLATTTIPYRIIQLFHVSHELGHRYKQSVYERAVYWLAGAGHWHLVVLVTTEAETATRKTTVRLLNWRTRGLVQTQNYALLCDILNKFSVYGLKPQLRTFQLLLRGYLLNHNYAQATETIHLMEREGFQVDSHTLLLLASAVRGLGLENTVKEEAENILEGRGPEQKGSVLNGLLQLYLSSHDLEGALRLLASVERQDDLNASSPTTSRNTLEPSANACTLAYTEDVQANLSRRIDSETYALLINHLIRRRSWKSLRNVIKRMKSSLASYDANLAAALVRMHLARGYWNWSLHVLQEVCGPSSLDRKLLRRLGYKKDKYYRPWARFTGHPTITFFNAIMLGAVEKRGLQSVPVVLALMEANNVSPNGTTLELILDFMQKERSLRPEAIARALNMLLSFPVEPTQRHLNVILKAIVARRKRYFRPYYCVSWRDRFRRFRRNRVAVPIASGKFKNDSIPPLCGPDLGIALHDLHGSPFLSSLLNPVLDNLKARAVKPNRETYAIRMSYDLYSFAPKEALTSIKEAFEHMRKHGMRPDLRHYSALVGAYSQVLDFRTIGKVVGEAEAEGALFSPSSRAILYTVMINTLGRKGNLAGVLRLYEEMLREGVKPDPGVLAAVANAFRMNRRNKRARRILIDLWPSVAPFPMQYRHAGLDQLLFVLRSYEPDGRPGRLIRKKKGDAPLWMALKIVSEKWRSMASGKAGMHKAQHFPICGTRLL